jgi:hypothetical protein
VVKDTLYNFALKALAGNNQPDSRDPGNSEFQI